MVGVSVRRAGLVAAVVVLLVAGIPTSLAAGANGSFSASRMELPRGTTSTFVPEAGWFPSAESFVGFHLASPHVLIQVYDVNYTDVGSDQTVLVGIPPPLTHTNETRYELDDVQISFASVAPGWLGGYFGPHGSAVLSTSTSAEMWANTSTLIGNSRIPRQGTQPNILDYGVMESGPHLLLNTTGVFSYEGAGGIKLVGPTLVVHGEESGGPADLTVPTGDDFVRGAATQNERQRWAYISFDQASWSLETNGKILAASRAASSRWDGDAQMIDPTGEIDVGSSRYTPAVGDGSAMVTGRFTGALAPVAQGSDTRVSATLEGDLTRTSLLQSQTIVPRLGWAPSLGWLVVLGACVAGASAAGVVVQRRRAARIEPFSVDELASFANVAAECERFGEALQWIESAIKLAPTSSRLQEDRAFFLAELGEVDEALRAYGQAAALSTTGDALLGAARLALDHDRPRATVLEYLDSALERSPGLVAELDDGFGPLKHEPAYRRMVARARRRDEGGTALES